jgi:hypothetical protein
VEEDINCYTYHSRECPTLDPHPLIKDREFFSFMSEYRTLVKKNQDEVQSTRDEVEFVEKLGKYKMKRDPRASPDYNERTKICKKSYPDPSGKLKPDEFPFILTDLVICGLG